MHGLPYRIDLLQCRSLERGYRYSLQKRGFLIRWQYWTEDLEHPLMGDREFLFNWLGYNQFTLKEMHSGLAIEILADIYG